MVVNEHAVRPQLGDRRRPLGFAQPTRDTPAGELVAVLVIGLPGAKCTEAGGYNEGHLIRG